MLNYTQAKGKLSLLFRAHVTDFPAAAAGVSPSSWTGLGLA